MHPFFVDFYLATDIHCFFLGRLQATWARGMDGHDSVPEPRQYDWSGMGTVPVIKSSYTIIFILWVLAGCLTATPTQNEPQLRMGIGSHAVMLLKGGVSPRVEHVSMNKPQHTVLIACCALFGASSINTQASLTETESWHRARRKPQGAPIVANHLPFPYFSQTKPWQPTRC